MMGFLNLNTFFTEIFLKFLSDDLYQNICKTDTGAQTYKTF
jgi:hypothetical protein